jgi:ketosteroid isomerase-like protein
MSTTFDDVEAIKQLKARYFRLMDTKDWVGFRDVFTDDFVLDATPSGGRVVDGADAFVELVAGLLAGAVTVHQGHMPEIELVGADEATGIWALHDIVIRPDGTRLDGYGHYHERYRKGLDGWRIASSMLTRLHSDTSHVEP